MVRNAGLKVTDGSTSYLFPLQPTGKGGRGYTLETRSWEPGDPAVPWRIPLHPWDAGLNIDRLGSSPRSVAKSNADTSNPGILCFPPALTTLTFTNATTPFKSKTLNGVLYVLGGRYIYSVSSAYAVAEDMDFGAGNAGVDMEIFNGELIVAMGASTAIWKRTITADAATSGTANAAITTTNTTLADTRLALQVNAWIGGVVTCNGKTMTVTSNTATVFTGASWSGGGNPGNGNAWSATGYWTQATDATYAIALGAVDNRLWRGTGTNGISSCTTAPLTLTSWGSEGYTVGNTSYAIHTIIDYGGVPWVIKGDGAYQPDPATRFHNQTPQARDWPNTENGKGAWTGFAALWVPTVSQTLRITPGKSKGKGPEVTARPDMHWLVRGGVNFNGANWLLCTDAAGAEPTMVVKMVPDDSGLSGREYIYYEYVNAASFTVGKFIAAMTSPTNPTIVFGYGNNGSYFKQGRGGGRDIDDANFTPGAAMTTESGVVMPGPDLSVHSTLVGVKTTLKLPGANDTLAVDYRVDGGSWTALLTTQEGGGTQNITQTTNWEAITRYAPTGATAVGQFFEFKNTGAQTGAAGTTRPEIREQWAFGYSNPDTLDVISLAIPASAQVTVRGLRQGRDGGQTLDLFRSWRADGTVLLCELQGYEESRNTRFRVTAVDWVEQIATPGAGENTRSMGVIRVALTRVDFAGAYADA